MRVDAASWRSHSDHMVVFSTLYYDNTASDLQSAFVGYSFVSRSSCVSSIHSFIYSRSFCASSGFCFWFEMHFKPPESRVNPVHGMRINRLSHHRQRPASSQRAFHTGLNIYRLFFFSTYQRHRGVPQNDVYVTNLHPKAHLLLITWFKKEYFSC